MQVGYKLRDVSSGAILQTWGGVWGECPGFPNPLMLPNGGSHIHAGAPGVNYDGYVVDPWIYDDLPALKIELARRVNDAAETCRMQFLSPGSGQTLTYTEKHAQALAVHDMGEAAANAMSESARRADFPTLAASVGIEANTLWDCSQLVLTRYLQFASISYYIERAKLAGKQLISIASDAAAAQAAYEAITWPKP